jgi:hypothetical protein
VLGLRDLGVADQAGAWRGARDDDRVLRGLDACAVGRLLAADHQTETHE